MLPKLQEIRTYLAKVKKVPADYLEQIDKAIAAIETSTATPTLVSLKDFKSRTQAGK
jgi:hypothetical protein